MVGLSATNLSSETARVTMLPGSLKAPLKEHLKRVKAIRLFEMS
jgi:hypothetical protein